MGPRAGRPFAGAFLAAILIVGAACGKSADAGPPALTGEEIAEAREVARRFLTAIEGADCDTVRTLGGKEMTAAECADFVDEWEDHEVALIEIIEATLDQRNRRAVIVKSRVTQEREERTMLVRVEKRDASWIVSL